MESQRLGGEVVIAGNSSAERHRLAHGSWPRNAGSRSSPLTRAWTSSPGREPAAWRSSRTYPDVETILVPVGGGGLIAGIAAAVAALKPSVRVVGVEPEARAKLAAALEAGRAVQLELTESLADGLLPLSVGELPFAVLSGVVREAVQVSEDGDRRGGPLPPPELELVAEPSGAVTTAALLSRARPARRVRPLSW